MATSYETWGGTSPDAIIDHLRVKSMKYNYPDLVLKYGPLEADRRMGPLFGPALWASHQEEIHWWFENEFHRDGDGNVVV